ncbi:MAG: DNA ligase LigA-related protein [Lachnospiraceae bacterium]
MDVKQEMEALRAEIMEHNRHYYDEDAPVISDFEYDALMRRLEELEAAHPEFYCASVAHAESGRHGQEHIRARRARGPA